MKLHGLVFAVPIGVGLAFASATLADSLRLAEYKDDLFRYPAIAGSDPAGDRVTVLFDHERDVVARDEIPDERTRAEYVSLDAIPPEADLVLKRDGQTVRYVGVGRIDGNARIVAIFLHGLGATRFDGLNDWRSGGNLNRIKNLMVRNDGVYLSADYSAFKSRARRQIAALVAEFAENSPGAPIVLMCASIGARVCWDLAEDPASAAHIDGMIMIAAVGGKGFAESGTVRDPARWIPIYMAHGTGDRSVSWRPQEELFRQIKSVAPGYPVKLVLFETGTHRAPLRMTDWRLAINWMLEVNAE